MAEAEEDDGFDDSVSSGDDPDGLGDFCGPSRSSRAAAAKNSIGGNADAGDDDDNPFTAFAAAQAKTARRSAAGRGGGGGDMDDVDLNDNESNDTEDDNPFSAYAVSDALQKNREADNNSAGGVGGGDQSAAAAQYAAGGSARKKKDTGWGADGGGSGGSNADDDTAVADNKTKKTKNEGRFVSDDTEVEEDYGDGIFTIDGGDNDDEEVNSRTFNKQQQDDDDSAYEDASDDEGGEDDANPFAKYTSTNQNDDEDDDLFDEGDDDEDDDEESPSTSRKKDENTTPTGVISYNQDFDVEHDDYDLDGHDEEYVTVKEYGKRRGQWTTKQWMAMLGIVICIFVLFLIIIVLSVLFARDNKNQQNQHSSNKEGDSAQDTQDFGDPLMDKDGTSALPSRPHVVTQSYVQTYSGVDVETLNSDKQIEDYQHMMSGYLTYYIGEDDIDNVTITVKDEEDGTTKGTITSNEEDDGGDEDKAAAPYEDGEIDMTMNEGTLVFDGGSNGGGDRGRRSLLLEMDSITVRCTFNYQRLSSTSVRNRRHKPSGGTDHINGPTRRRGNLRHRRRAAEVLPEELATTISNIDDPSLQEKTTPAPGFYDADGNREGDSELPLGDLPDIMTTEVRCPDGTDSTGSMLPCPPQSLPNGEVPVSPSVSTMTIVDQDNPNKLGGEEEAIATARATELMSEGDTLEDSESMHLEIVFTMIWSAAPAPRRPKKDMEEGSGEDDDVESSIIEEISAYPSKFEGYMNSHRGKKQLLHDMTKMMDLDVSVVSNVTATKPGLHVFIETNKPTMAPTPAPTEQDPARTSSTPAAADEDDGCCWGVCWFSC